MRINIDMFVEFKKFRTWFKGASEFNVIVEKNMVILMCKLGGLTHVARLDAIIDADVDLPLGFSFISSLLLDLPVKNKGHDEFKINISQSNVVMELNGRVVNVMFAKTDPGVLSNLSHEKSDHILIDKKELYWLLNVAKYYRHENLQICGDKAFLNTEHGIYYTKLTNSMNRNFCFTPSVLNRAKQEISVHLSDKLEVANPPYYTFSLLYKPDQTLVDTVNFVIKQKAFAKIDMSLNSHKQLIKALRTSTFITDFNKKTVSIRTKENEQLVLQYDLLEIDAKVSDLEKYTEILNHIYNIDLNGFVIHQMIANEKTVSMFITAYANLIKFADNSYLILRGGL